MANYNLFDAASLAMVPVGYKANKLYSVKPDTGAGDFDFSRASSATRVNADGNIEKERGNLFLRSNVFNVSPWASTGMTITSGQSGYDGSNDAWLIDSTGGYVFQGLSLSGLHTFSVYAKQGTADGIRLRIDAATDANIYISLTDGSESFPSTGVYYTTTSVGGGWWRVSVTINDSSIVNARFYAIDNTGSSTTGTIYIQDAQLEQGLVATEYIETTTSPVYKGVTDNIPRIDYTSGCGSLLLEPSRTNLVPQSEYLDSWGATNVVVTSNDITSPEGVINASKLDRTATAGYISQNVSLSGNQTFSVFLKKGDLNFGRILGLGTGNPNVYFDLENGLVETEENATGSIEDFGDGWYRCSIVFNTTTTAVRVYPVANDGNYGGAIGYIYAFGAQLEAGSYPTSYIPTYGSSVTRVADGCTKTGISDLIGQSEGTLFVEFDHYQLATAGFQRNFVLAPTGSDTANRVSIIPFTNDDNKFYLTIRYASTNIEYEATTPIGNLKIAIAYKSGSSAMYINGTQVFSSSTSFAFAETLNRFSMTQSDSVKQALLFKSRLTDNELAALTRPYDTYQEWVDGEGLTWESKSCTTQSILELQNL